MNITSSVMILCSKMSEANSIAFSLQNHGLITIVPADREEALRQIAKSPVDMVIVENQLNGQSGLEFLAQVRRAAPLIMRAILANSDFALDPRSLINEIGACAVFTTPIDCNRVWKLLALEGPVTHGEAEGTDARRDLAKMIMQNNLLRKENHLLTREIQNLRRNSTPSAPTSSAPSPPNPDEEDFLSTVEILLRDLDRMLQSPDIVLPILPAVGLEVQKILADPNCSFEELAGQVGLEQGMSARILQVANSPLYAGLERIRNLQQAVSRLGLRETRNILQVVIAENLFHTKSRSLVSLMARLWMHSLCCAYSNETIARLLMIPESDDYFMMGLLHDIGKLLVIHFLEQGFRQGLWQGHEITEAVVLEVMARRHNSFGTLLMQKWQYSTYFEQVALNHNNCENLGKFPECVVVTHFSNIVARRIGHSLVPYRQNDQEDEQLAVALNISPGMHLRIDQTLNEVIGRIRQTYCK